MRRAFPWLLPGPIRHQTKFSFDSPSGDVPRPLLIWQVALPCYANAERGYWLVSVPLTHSEVIRVRDALSLSPANKDASASSGLVDVLLKIGRERRRLMESLREALLRGDDAEALERARELTGLPSKRAI